MKGILLLASGAIFLLFLTTCELSSPEEYMETNPTGGTIELASDLFIPVENTSVVNFETNDTNFWSERGYSLWTHFDEADPAFSSREVNLAKISGNATAGYGCIYSYRDDAVFGETMLIVMVNTKGEYCVGEYALGEFEYLKTWEESSFINAGYNQNNIIRLEYDSVQVIYNLYINGNFVTDFRDDDEPFHTSGQHGYLVVISPLDKFPQVPVEAIFEEIE